MKASRQVVVLFLVFASLIMPASLGHCIKHESRQLQQLPVRTYIVDDFQDGLSGFAVYQKVAPEVWMQRKRRPPPSVQLCEYDRLGSHSWPPTAVCWVQPASPQHQLQPSLQTTAELAEAAPEVDLAAFKSQTSPSEIAEVGSGVLTGFLAGLPEMPMVQSVGEMMDVLGINDMPGLGKDSMTLPPDKYIIHFIIINL